MTATDTALVNRALDHQRAGRLTQAEAIWRHLLAVDADNTTAGFHLGVLLVTLGRLHEADACFAHVATRAPNSAETHGNLGLVRHRLGRLDEAVAHYRLALDLRPDLAALRNNLAGALQELGRVEESLEVYRNLDREVHDPAVAANVLTAPRPFPRGPEPPPSPP